MPLRAGSKAINPATGSHWEVIESDAETAGRGFTIEVRCAPNAPADILEHVHLDWTETFEIVSGSARYKLNGVEGAASAGESVTMPPNQPHVHPWNAGDAEMVYRQVARFARPDPAAAQEVLGVFFTLFGLTAEGKIGRRGLPKNPLQFAATLRTLVRHDGYDASVPIPAQKLLAATLGWLAEAIGYRAVYPRFVGD